MPKGNSKVDSISPLSSESPSNAGGEGASELAVSYTGHASDAASPPEEVLVDDRKGVGSHDGSKFSVSVTALAEKKSPTGNIIFLGENLDSLFYSRGLLLMRRPGGLLLLSMPPSQTVLFLSHLANPTPCQTSLVYGQNWVYEVHV